MDLADADRPQFTNHRIIGILVAVVLVTALAAAVLIWRNTDTSTTGSVSDSPPAVVEHIEGSDVARITLTDRAAERLGIETDTVRANGTSGLVIPYSALYYDADGGTWVYTNPEPLTYVRHAVEVDRIEGDRVFLTAGPEAGTAIVTVGVPELYGTEYEIGH
jgi:hypothetical protein